MPPDFCDRARECGQRSFLIMAGALDSQAVKAEILSYEGGDRCGLWRGPVHPHREDPDRAFLKGSGPDPYVRLAVDSFTHYLKTGRRMTLPEGLPAELTDRKAGAFVTLHKEGNLRGCIGTIFPVQKSLAEEIIHNAVSAAFRDPRFEPVREEELPLITCSVDVLEAPEPIRSEKSWTVKEYGVIVSSGGRRGPAAAQP